MASFGACGALKEEDDEETRKRSRELQLNNAFMGFLGCKQDVGKAGEETPQKVNTRRLCVDSEASTTTLGTSTLIAPSMSELDDHLGDMAQRPPMSDIDDHLGATSADPVSRVCSPFHKTRRLSDIVGNEAVTKPDAKPQLTLKQAGEFAHLDALARMATIDEFKATHLDDSGVMQETPPTTPRVTTGVAPDSDSDSEIFQPPPDVLRTPFAKKPAFRSPPSPCRGKSRIPDHSLLRALQRKSVEQVRAILQHDPEAAREVFWDHDFEPPLCAAVRLECSADIVRLLLEYGADPQVKNMRGFTPSRMLQEPVIAQPTLTPPLFATPWFAPDGLDTWLEPFGSSIPQRLETPPGRFSAHELGVQETVDADVVNSMVWRHEVASLIDMHGGMAA